MERAQVVVGSGHMVDTPDRPKPRFPSDQVERVRRAVREALARWSVGSQTTVITGGARGADIIIAEEGLRRGAHLVLYLALPPDEFEQRSVALRGTDWHVRFRRLLGVADVRISEGPEAAGEDGLFVRTNERILELARSLGGDLPHALLVWNGMGGDGPGGTRHFVESLGYERPSPSVCVIDPTRRTYEARQDAEGPKKMLALDGGGIRGALSLEILRSVENVLRQRYGDGLVLADWFDYIAGTSTGAIIAAGLALGKSVAGIQQQYRVLGRHVFSKRFFPMWVRSKYRDGPLTREIEAFYGSTTTLGDPALRTLLLLVLHNANTDSTWPITNCTRAKYNSADRYLLTPPDRNLDIPLATLVRGSTAAPVYFLPQRVTVGRNEFVFQDGGITPFNNPALLMFLVATLPEYGLAWPVGERQLLLVSVGTGTCAAVHPSLNAKWVNVFFQTRNLPAVVMNSASFAQEMLCRSLGRCLVGAKIDREFGDRIDVPGVAGRNLFTYLRLDADMSDEALSDQGLVHRRQRRKLRKLDHVDSIPELEQIGRRVAESVDISRHIEPFL